MLTRLGEAVIEGIEKPVLLRMIERVRWPKREKPDLSPVRCYLADRMRATIPTSDDIELAYCFLMAEYAAIKFYARAAAIERGRDALHADDVARALGIVPDASAALSARKFRKFLFHPAFPSSMTA